MPKVFTVTPKFKLIVEHLKAVRTLNAYVNGGLSEDMQALTNYLKQDLNRGILWPASWKDLNTPKGSKSNLHSSPATSTMNCLVPKWEVVEDDFIAVQICPFSPVQDVDAPCVNLYLPENWNQRHEFIAKFEPPPGFEHASQYPVGEIEETTPFFKYVRYESHIGPEGFDAAGFIAAFREATKALVDLEKDIDQILESLGLGSCVTGA